MSIDAGATFAGTANAAPGDTLTYRITIENTGASNATVVQISDVIADYTTYTATMAKYHTAAVTYTNALTPLLDPSADGDNYDYTDPTVTYTHGTRVGGASAAGAFAVIYYQVTVD